MNYLCQWPQENSKLKKIETVKNYPERKSTIETDAYFACKADEK